MFVIWLTLPMFQVAINRKICISLFFREIVGCTDPLYQIYRAFLNCVSSYHPTYVFLKIFLSYERDIDEQLSGIEQHGGPPIALLFSIYD
jgi:hypothetical protein